MPAYLGEANCEYNQIRRVKPDDAIAKLNYYCTSSTSINSAPKRQTSHLFGDGRATTDDGEYQSNNARSTSASSYSSRLVNLMLGRQNDGCAKTMSSSSASSSAESEPKRGRNGVISSGELVLRNLRNQITRRMGSSSIRVEPCRVPRTETKLSSASPIIESSGFSEETNINATMERANKKREMNADLSRFLCDQEIDWNLFREIQQASGMFNDPDLLSSRPVSRNQRKKRVSVMKPAGPGHILGHHGSGTRARLRRRKFNRTKQTTLTPGTDAYGNPILIESSAFNSNPYALGELFSQSEIPGFREIFSSDSYLRKFCWIVAFLFMTVLSLNDMTALISEFYEYPITVDVRLRDTARLPFPAVTVCNLNVVRYSGLCSARFSSDLANQIPGDLRNKLCGIQVEKQKLNDSDGGSEATRPPAHDDLLADINNIGLTKTTTTTTSTLASTTAILVPTQAPDSLSAVTFSSSATTSPAPTIKWSTLANPGLAATTTIPSLTAGDDSPLPASTRQPSTTGGSTRRPSGSLDLGLDFKPAARASRGLKRKRSIVVNEERPDEGGGGGGGRPFVSSRWKLKIAAGQSKLKLAASGSRLASNTKQTVVRQPVVGNTQKWAPTSELNSASFGGQMLATATTPIPNHQSGMIMSTQLPKTTYSPPSSDDSDLTERQEREMQENLINWLAVMYQHDAQLTRSLGHQFDDMILRCTMKSINCTRQRAFDWHFTPTEGNCFTYKSKTKRRKLNDNNNNNYHSPGPQQYAYEEANLAGPNDGLELVLNLEKSEYISGSSQVGALVMVHHPDELGYAASEAIFIAPEFTTYIGLKMMNITRLPAPYPEYCVDSWPAEFQDSSNTIRNSTYSQQTCLKICLQKTIQAHCACQSAVLPIVEASPNESTTTTATKSSARTTGNNNETLSEPGAKQQQRVIICDTRKKHTRQCVRDVNVRAADRVHHCECPPKCQVVRYDKTISVARWPTREDKVSFDRGKMDVNFQNLAKVIVYFQTMTCEEVTQQAVFNAAKLFSALGGIMGMYVGFSFLSVFEIFEVMSRKLWHYSRIRLGTASWLQGQHPSSFAD